MTMSKKVMLMLLVMMLCIPKAFSLPLDLASGSAWGMADAGLSLDYESDSFLANPALLGLEKDKETSFLASLRFQDSLDFSNYTLSPFALRLERPVADWAISFISGSLAFSIQNRNSLEDRQQFANASEYTGIRNTLFQFDWATSRSIFSFGVTGRAVASSERSLVSIKDDRILLDYFVETTVGRYEAVDDVSSVTFGVGILVDYQWFKMGVVSDQLAYGSAEQSLVVSVDSLLKTLDWGFSFSSATYDETNQLHLLKFQGALDFVNLGSDINREVRLGISAKLQLLPTWSVSLQMGYRETKPTPSDLLKFSFAQGRQTVALNVRLDTFKFTLASSWPTAWYTKNPTAEQAVFLVGATLIL